MWIQILTKTSKKVKTLKERVQERKRNNKRK